MDCRKVGKLIFDLRTEKGMTQKALADAMNISDRTVSKWERGMGCPDVTLLRPLSDILGVDIARILEGELETNNMDRGNMKRIKFYVCPDCGNVLCGTGEADISCCGRKLAPLEVQEGEFPYPMTIEDADDELYVSIEHEMSKEHFISFIACVRFDRVLLVKLYPEQAAQVYVPKMRGGELYVCCNTHGLWKKRV